LIEKFYATYTSHSFFYLFFYGLSGQNPVEQQIKNREKTEIAELHV